MDWLEIPNVDVGDSLESAERQGRDVEYAEQRAVDIINLLREGVVVFDFFRVTYGSARKARGTLNTALFSYTFKGSERARPYGLVAYWDFGRRGWRSFYVWNVRSISPASGVAGVGIPASPFAPLDVDEDGDVNGPAMGPNNGKRPRSRSGELLTIGELDDGIYSGLTMRVLEGNLLAYAAGRFVHLGLIYDVVNGGLLNIPENYYPETRYDLILADTHATLYVQVGVPGAARQRTGLGPYTVLAEVTTPGNTDGIRSLSRVSKRNTVRVPR